jgi:hypothetical protein
MRGIGAVKSGGGGFADLHAFAEWPVNAERVGEFERANPISRPKPRANLDMTKPTIARLCLACKWHTEYSPHKIPVNIHNANRSIDREVRP